MKTFAATLGISSAAAVLMLGGAHLAFSAGGERSSALETPPAALAGIAPARSWMDPTKLPPARGTEVAESTPAAAEPSAAKSETPKPSKTQERASEDRSAPAARPAPVQKVAETPRRSAAKLDSAKRAEQSRAQRLAQNRARIRLAEKAQSRQTAPVSSAAAPRQAEQRHGGPFDSFFRGIFNDDDG